MRLAMYCRLCPLVESHHSAIELLTNFVSTRVAPPKLHQVRGLSQTAVAMADQHGWPVLHGHPPEIWVVSCTTAVPHCLRQSQIGNLPASLAACAP